MWFLGLWIRFSLICLLDSTALLQKRLLTLLGSIFYVNAANNILRSWSLVVYVRESVPELAVVWRAVAEVLPGWLVLNKCLQIF